MFNNNYGGFGVPASGGTPPDLSPYWKTNGDSSPATGPWDFGGNGFTDWSGASNVDAAPSIGFASVDTSNDSLSGLLLPNSGAMRLFGGNLAGTVYGSYEALANGNIIISSQGGDYQSNLTFQFNQAPVWQSSYGDNTVTFQINPADASFSFENSGALEGSFSYNAIDGISFSNSDGVISSVDNSDVENQVIYKLPNKEAGTETFAMLSDLSPSRMLSASNTTTTSNVASNVTGGSAALLANTSYEVDIYVRSTNTAGGVKYAVTFPAGATVDLSVFGTSSNQNTYTSSIMSVSGTLTTGNYGIAATGSWVRIKGTVITAGTAGTFQLQVASVTNLETSVVLGQPSLFKVNPVS